MSNYDIEIGKRYKLEFDSDLGHLFFECTIASISKTSKGETDGFTSHRDYLINANDEVKKLMSDRIENCYSKNICPYLNNDGFLSIEEILIRDGSVK